MVAAQGAVPLQEHTGQFGCHDGYLRGFGLITDGKVPEVTVAHQLAFAPGTMVADNRGWRSGKCPIRLRRIEAFREDTGEILECSPDIASRLWGQHHCSQLQGSVAN